MDIDFKENNQNQVHHIDSGSESAFIGSWSSSSSSSFLTNSFGSELDSNDADLTDDGDEFIAELTRQMADFMLDDNDANGKSPSKLNFQEPVRRSYADTVKKSIVGFQSEQNVTGDKQFQMYQVENQPRVEVVQSGGWGRNRKIIESTQHVKRHSHRHEQMIINNRGVRGGKEFVNGGNGYSGGIHVGSGLRAIFLGGPGSRNVVSGTGVFLPRSTTDATDQSRKKSGCSTVLVPTRVLQALEQHFTNMESHSPSNNLAQTHRNCEVKKEKTQTQESVSVDHQEPNLPQEWIY